MGLDDMNKHNKKGLPKNNLKILGSNYAKRKVICKKNKKM